jgi:NADP-dependent 3-hydroxy acid dehydrogenase YdfG
MSTEKLYVGSQAPRSVKKTRFQEPSYGERASAVVANSWQANPAMIASACLFMMDHPQMIINEARLVAVLVRVHAVGLWMFCSHRDLRINR